MRNLHFSKIGSWVLLSIGLAAPLENANAQIHKCNVAGQVVYQQEACERKGGTGAPLKIYPNRGGDDGSANPLEGSPKLKFEPLTVSPEEAKQAFPQRRSVLTAGLKDPASANFQDVRFVHVKHSSGNIVYLCGFINAKNSYGGYTGFKAFVSDGQSLEIESANFVRYRQLASLWYDIRPLQTYCLLSGTVVQ